MRLGGKREKGTFRYDFLFLHILLQFNGSNVREFKFCNNYQVDLI